MIGELSELTQSQTYEADALTFGLLVCLIVGICIVFGYAFHKFLERSPYDETSGSQYPADDVHRYDDWPELREFMQSRGIKNNADFERYMREKNNARK